MGMNAEDCQLLGARWPPAFWHQRQPIPMQNLNRFFDRDYATESFFEILIGRHWYGSRLR